MAILPSASVSIDDESGAGASGAKYAYVIGCTGTSADSTPRVITSLRSFLDQYDYSPSASYIASHIEETGLPVVFVGIPIATAGVMGSEDSSAVTGTAKLSVAAGAAGYLEEVDAILTVTVGGTVGTAGIVFTLSMDGGRTSKTVRLGTNLTYTVPRLGVVISFATGGTLIAGDVYSFRTTAPMWDGTGISGARANLAAQTKLARSMVVIGDVPTSVFAGYVTTAANAYETSHDRFIYARVNTKDRLPLAKKSKVKKSMSGAPSVTFAEVGATGDTITRATGSFVTDGFAVNDRITVAGTALNNFTDALVTAVTATVLTLDTQDLVAETIGTATIIGSETVTFAEVGASGDTITRSTGSWISDGFAVGDAVAVTGTSLNNVTTDAITALSATVMTLGTTDLAAEAIAGHRVSVVKVLSKAAWISAKDTAFASVADQKRIDIGVGRARKLCPITGWAFRRPASWAASIREYDHELHIPCWRKEDGVLDGWDLYDDDRNLYEFDERIDGGALSAGFTCFRTYANGPVGAFMGLSLTRALEDSILSRTHNMAVANEACAIVHAETEGAIGQSLVLKDDGTAEEASLSQIESKINTVLKERLLKSGPEGQIASGATWRASRNDVLSNVPATLTGVLDLRENAALEQIETTVKVA